MAATCDRTPKYAGVPGKARLTIVVIPEGAPDPYLTLHDGTIAPLHPYTLGTVLDSLGGPEGYLTDPLAGQKLFVSLKAWERSDPHATRVVLGWQFNPKLPVSATHRHLFDEWSLHNDRYSILAEDVVIRTWDSTEAFPFVR